MEEYTVRVYSNKTKWYQNGDLHRTDGPAIEYSDGEKHWYQNNQRHRTDGPASEYADGEKHWFQNGLRHRTDGPASEYSNGAEAENNRFMFSVRGFNNTEHEPTKIKLEHSINTVIGERSKEFRLRGKTASPEKIVAYLSAHCNKISSEITPRFLNSI